MAKTTAKKKKTWGGARPGSGPKPKEASEIKEPITMYFKKIDIENAGGKEAFKNRVYELLK